MMRRMRTLGKKFVVGFLAASMVAVFLSAGFDTTVFAAADDVIPAPIEYTMDTSAGTITSTGYTGTKPVSDGMILWPGEKMNTKIVYESKLNTIFTAHVHPDDGKNPMIYSMYAVFSVISSDEKIDVSQLADIKKEEVDIVTGGYDVDKLTYEKRQVVTDFTARDYPVIVKFDFGSTHTAFAACCAEKCSDRFYEYHYSTGDTVKLIPIVKKGVPIEFTIDPTAELLGGDNYPQMLSFASASKDYSYDIPIKLGGTFNGFDFRDENGTNLNGLFTDDKKGTITFEGVTVANYEQIVSVETVKAIPGWNNADINVTFDPNGGFIDDNPELCVRTISYSGNSESLSRAPSTYRAGYTFDGWYVGETKIAKYSDIPQSVWNAEQRYTLKAKWNKDETAGCSVDAATASMEIYKNDGFPATYKNDWIKNVKTVKIGDGVTEIPGNAFTYPYSLETVVFGKNVKTIGARAFSGNEKLQKINLPEGIEEIGEYAFYNCKLLNNVVIPNSCLTVGDNIFKGCSALDEVLLPNGMKIIPSSMFYNTGVKEFCVENGVTEISSYAFYGSGLKKIYLPNTIEKIGYSAFYQCEDFAEIVYFGTEKQWEQVEINTGNLSNAPKITFQPEEAQPAYTGTPQAAESHTHVGKKVSKVEPTCASYGVKAYYKCSCGKYYTDSACKNEIGDLAAWKKGDGRIAKLDHTYKTLVTKATISTNGKKETKCSVCGKVKETVTIYAAKTIKLSKDTYVYDGKVKKPTVTVKNSKGNAIDTTNYSVTYDAGRKDVGKYNVKVTLKGDYKGSKSLSFIINPKATTLKSVTPASKAFTAAWSKQTTQVDGYEIEYALDKAFTSSEKKVEVTKNSTTSKKISNLTSKKTYYVRVRTYKKVGTKKYCSEWSKILNVKTK